MKTTDTIATTNKEIIQRMYREVLADWNMSLVDELVADRFVSHDWPEDSAPGGNKGVDQIILKLTRI